MYLSLLPLRKTDWSVQNTMLKMIKNIPPKGMKKGGERRASTGSMPDFAYSGEGVKLGAVSEGSAAEKAGLHQGDIIIKLADYQVGNLRDYSNALKSYQPGDEIEVVYLREGKENSTKIVLSER